MPITNDIERLHGRIAELEARVEQIELGTTVTSGHAEKSEREPDQAWCPYMASYPYTVPVEAGTLVDVMLGDGTFSYRRGPRSLNWSSVNSKGRRIVAYRVCT